jgi:DNA topoisomerase 2-associated protein PAT1
MVTIALHSLQGALGRTSGRSYKAAPRQLLQVDPNSVGTSPTLSHAHPHISKEDTLRTGGEGAAKEAAKLGREALGDAASVSQPDVLSTPILLIYH